MNHDRCPNCEAYTEELDALRADLAKTLVANADHAAELARVEKLLDAARDAARVAIDQMDVWQRACAAASLMHTQTLTANAILRAECEAWRAADLRHDWIRDNTVGGVAATPEVDTLICEMNATDAAGILKGGES